MKVVQITPGSGDNFYCENCLRDVTLVRAMRRLGHDVTMIPLYLPLQADKEEPVTNAPIFFGGVNVYLQQKLSLFRRTPRWIDKLFDSPRLLEWVGKKAGMTSAKDLGETTISTLRGEHGHQLKELDRLVEWLGAAENKPDVVCLSNVLLAGLARRIRERLGVPVICLLQDEEGFLDGLGSPYSEQAWELVAQRADHVDAFVAVSRFYADLMRERLGVDAGKVHVSYVGIETGKYTPAVNRPAVATIGFLSRMCAGRGLGTLADAFILLKKDERFKGAKLRVCGGRLSSDEAYIGENLRKLDEAGLRDDVELLDDFGTAARLEFLSGVSVIAVPETEAVAYGLWVLEASAAGVPVVAPRIGVLPELVEMTGGGVLYEPNDAATLAGTLAELLCDEEALGQLGARGRAGVVEKFNVEKTVAETVSLYERIAQGVSGR